MKIRAFLTKVFERLNEEYQYGGNNHESAQDNSLFGHWSGGRL